MKTITFLIYIEKLHNYIYSVFFTSHNAFWVFLQDGRTPLHIAAINGDFKSIQLLISEMASIEALDKVCIYREHILEYIATCIISEIKSCFEFYVVNFEFTLWKYKINK